MLIEDILPHEKALKRRKQLPTQAAPPQLRTRLLKTLGTRDADALRLESKGLFNLDTLLAKAIVAREQREAAGISDSVEAKQPLAPPAFDTKLVSKRIEVLWPYRRGGKLYKIWASGTVRYMPPLYMHDASMRHAICMICTCVAHVHAGVGALLMG